jgi:transcriptional regulator with XRE-family HTH domain
MTTPRTMTARQLRLWRARLGWTQAQAAAALGMTEDGYAQLERGRRKVQAPIAWLARYVERYGVLQS